MKVKQLSTWRIDYMYKITIKTITGTELSSFTFADALAFVEGELVAA